MLAPKLAGTITWRGNREWFYFACQFIPHHAFSSVQTLLSLKMLPPISTFSNSETCHIQSSLPVSSISCLVCGKWAHVSKKKKLFRKKSDTCRWQAAVVAQLTCDWKEPYANTWSVYRISTELIMNLRFESGRSNVFLNLIKEVNDCIP